MGCNVHSGLNYGEWKPRSSFDGKGEGGGVFIKCNTRYYISFVISSWLHSPHQITKEIYYSVLVISYFIFILDAATLTEVFPCFFLGCKANARV